MLCHHPESGALYPLSGCYSSHLHLRFSQKPEQMGAGNLTRCQGVSGGCDFGKLEAIWQVAHWTAVICQLCSVVILSRVSEVRMVLFMGCKLIMGPVGYISIGLESWDPPEPTTSHGWFYAASACCGHLSMPFVIFSQEIEWLSILVVSRCFVLPADAPWPCSSSDDQHTPQELSAHFLLRHIWFSFWEHAEIKMFNGHFKIYFSICSLLFWGCFDCEAPSMPIAVHSRLVAVCCRLQRWMNLLTVSLGWMWFATFSQMLGIFHQFLKKTHNCVHSYLFFFLPTTCSCFLCAHMV